MPDWPLGAGNGPWFECRSGNFKLVKHTISAYILLGVTLMHLPAAADLRIRQCDRAIKGVYNLGTEMMDSIYTQLWSRTTGLRFVRDFDSQAILFTCG